MRTEKEKMLAGDLYDARDRILSAERLNARKLLKELNGLEPDQRKAFNRVLRALFPNSSTRFFIQPPFFCDYGYNIRAEEDVFLNFNCTILDVTSVLIGARTLIGPQVQLYTALHPTDVKTRATGLEYARPIEIGQDVWIGGGAIVCPGVTIGAGSIIGAGSVVTRDIPSGVFAAGNPCTVIRNLPNEDKA